MLLRALAAAAAVAASAQAAPCTLSLGTWSACRNASDPDTCLLTGAPVPTTALAAMLANGSVFPGVVDPFVDDALASIPDISVTGAEFYTLTWATTLTASAGCADSTGFGVLTLPQVNYRAYAALDGDALPPPLGATAEGAAGAYTRFTYDLGPLAALAAGGASGVHALTVRVAPPDHPGNASNTCKGCGQGGNHELAQDVSPQDAAGWDWVAGVPDRNTGLVDAPTVAALGAPVQLGDPVGAVAAMPPPPGPGPDGAVPRSAAWVVLAVTVGARALPSAGVASVAGTLSLSIPSLGVDGLTVAVTLPASAGGAWGDVAFPPVNLTDVPLWWPHTLGAPTLHDAVVTFYPAAAIAGAAASAPAWAPVALPWRLGVRTVTSAVDPVMGGRVFAVNGYRVYLEGGNFINPDLLLRDRAPAASGGRYAAEVRLHAEAGLNLLRLWGGHGGHPAALYDAADALGVLVFFEFWGSGDNNGRWAGNYSWPLDHALYLAAAGDSIRLTRSHASLLLYCAGNELFPLDKSPSPDLAAGLVSALDALDPRRTPYVQSSMGSTYGVDKQPQFDPQRVLAPLDGPYGILDERHMFTRNPGLYYGSNPPVRADTVPIAFQPELGSVSCPEADSLARFLSPAVAGAFPPANATGGNDTHPVWTYHRYLPFTDGEGWDHLYAYGPPGNASEYALRAQLAQLRQYQALYQGFAAGAWTWYGAMIMWKTQGPWPAFRGALYDPFLAPTGSFWGVRAATGGYGGVAGVRRLRVFLNQANNTVGLFNGGLDGVDLTGGTAWVTAFDVATGVPVAAAAVVQQTPDGLLPSGGVVHLPAVVAWPDGAVPAGSVLLYRLSVTLPVGGAAAGARSEYWLSSLSTEPGAVQDYSALGALRAAGPSVRLVAAAVGALSPDGSTLTVTLDVIAPVNARQVALAVRAVLRDAGAAVTSATGAVDDRVLPAWADAGYFHLAPGEGRTVTITADWTGKPAPAPDALTVTLDGWTVVPQSVPVPVAVAAAA